MSYLPPLGPADGLEDAPQQLPGGRGEQPGELGVEGGPLPGHQLPGGLLGGGEGQLPVLAGQDGEEEGEAGAQLLLLLTLGQQLQCPGVVGFGEVLSFMALVRLSEVQEGKVWSPNCRVEVARIRRI